MRVPSENSARHIGYHTYSLTEKSRGEEGGRSEKKIGIIAQSTITKFFSSFLSLLFLVFFSVSTTKPEDPLYIYREQTKRKRQKPLQSITVKLLFIYFVTGPFLQ